ncbi:MAG: Coenzyme F420 hydrogenase/dehydrogenase, beta subunit C-terminal domain [[Clostridium] leptum]
MFIKAKEELAKDWCFRNSLPIDGLKGYLRGKTYDNLLTVDLICHGVPSSKMFQDYISDLCVKLGGQVIGFEFRDKTAGWGLNGKITYVKENKIISKSLPCSDSSYYSLESTIYRKLLCKHQRKSVGILR